MKRIFKYIGGFFLAFTCFVLLYLITAWGLSRITIDREANSKEDIAIYIKTNGVHTDIVVPVSTNLIDWSKEIKFENTTRNDSTWQYLAMGWGDKGFYLETPNWADLKFSVAFKAVFGLDNTAIHATFYHRLEQDETCKKIMISLDQYSRLINYIKESFQKDNAGHFINIKTHANYGESDAFYEANGHYSLFHTCNTWANNALKSSGQKCCLWTAFDKGIFLKYK